MRQDLLARRSFLTGATRAAAVYSASCFAQTGIAQTGLASDTSELDAFILRYIERFNVPGLTLGLASRSSITRTATFGLADLETRAPLTPDHLFHMGSLTKSFVAVTLLQLREEGKVDFDKPVLDYLPWLPIETDFGAVTTHHLLTHTSGLPGNVFLFQSDPSRRHVQAFKPGERFDYCNLGFTILGHLITKLDQRPWTQAVRERIMTPLQMSSSNTISGDSTRDREASGYLPFFEDRVHLRNGRLTKARRFAFENAAGSVVSTPADMARYMQMLLKHGEGPKGRILSPASFDLFSNPYIPAPLFSPTASYGYGIGVDQVEGHTILRHMGNGPSHLSAISLDLDSGVAAFASVNAQIGSAPNAVTQFAVRLMRASTERSPAPKPSEMPDALFINHAAQFAGVYLAADGRKLEVVASGDGLTMSARGRSFALEAAGGLTFLSRDVEFQRFPLVFGRAERKTENRPGDATNSDSPDIKPAPERVVELSYGEDWYTNSRYTGPGIFSSPAEFGGYTGHYVSEIAWPFPGFTTVTVVLRKGTLWLNGVMPLKPLGGRLFRLGMADTLEFDQIVEGRANLVKLYGLDLRRTEVT